jgi:uncharacterized protein (TIGR04255 family)
LVKAHRHYDNAPITEGLIDIRVKLPSDIDLSSFDAFFERVKDKYPTRQDRKLFEGTFSTVPRVEAAAKETKIGYLFRSADGKRVLQARLDGFTFSRLKPYENWGALRDEAKRLWDTYREIVKPIQVTRVAVRYINQIDIPLPMRDFKDFFRTIPEVSPDLPQGLSGFLMQLQIPQEDISALLVITQTMLVPPPSPVVASVILDIDLFKVQSGFETDDEVWTLLESFRDRKNEIFEACITDKARQLFGPST